MRTLKPEQTMTLARATRRHYAEDGRFSRSFASLLKEQADYLLGVGPGRKVDGLRSQPPKQEVLLSSDYIERVMHPSL